MKKVLLIIVAPLLLAGCGTYKYSQTISLFPSETTGKPSEGTDYYIFEEADGIYVAYDFWMENGNAGCIVTNDTDKIITIEAWESYYIRNGVAYDYFAERILEERPGVYAHEKKVVIVPPHTSRLLNPFKISDWIYVSAKDDFGSYQPRRTDFTPEDSPVTFENRIVIVDEDGKRLNVSHKFYVSRVMNNDNLRYDPKKYYVINSDAM